MGLAPSATSRASACCCHPAAFALSVLHPAAPSRRETLDTASASMAMAAPTSWWEWLAGLWNSLRGPPDPGTPEARLEELRVGALLAKEEAKPPGERDEERIHQLELEHTKLMLENVQVGRPRRRRRRHERRQQQFNVPGRCQCHRWRVDSAASTCFFDA